MGALCSPSRQRLRLLQIRAVKLVEECQKKWKKIRDNYRKAVKARTDSSGSAGGKRRPIRYEKELQFLRPFIQERQQVSNLDSSTDETTQSDQTADILSPRPLSELSNHSRPPLEPVSKSAELIERFLNNKEQEQKDHVQSFFMSMATTVKTLPPYLQTKIKRDVFKIINDAEEQYQKALLEDNSYVSNSHFDSPETYTQLTQNTYPSIQNYNTTATYVPS
ncbi:jg23405, partial [Pararge aegeria aegeria]